MQSLPTPLLHEEQAARILGMSSAWLRRKRWEGAGPPYIKHGRAVRYELAALVLWISKRRVDPGGEGTGGGNAGQLLHRPTAQATNGR